MMTTDNELLYDWNNLGSDRPLTPVTILDESLRDGIQSPSATDPPLESKIRLLHLLEQLGVQHICLGFPGSSQRADRDAIRLAKEIVQCNLRIRPACAARTQTSDIQAIVKISQEASIAIEVMTFIGTSPIRLWVEDWDLDFLQRQTQTAIALAVQEELPVTYITEDTIRSQPATLKLLFQTALDSGAKGLCLCDTVGHATPSGVKNLVKFTRDVIAQTGTQSLIDWHGHNDRGLGLSNAIVAIAAGVDRVHGTLLGIGERVGNTAIDQLLVNLKLLDLWEADLFPLAETCQLAHHAFNVPIPNNYPVFGRDAFRTATGVHAAAVIKAERKDSYLADLIYSGVPAALFGRQQEIEISHQSGISNVIYWLQKHHIPQPEDLVKAILNYAKASHRLLSPEEILEIVRNRE